MRKIVCIGKDENEYHFRYNFEEEYSFGRKVINFWVEPVAGGNKDFFFFSITEVDENTFRVTAMQNSSGEEVYKAKGIPERMISESALLTRKRIISSPAANEETLSTGTWRTDKATAVWRRLEKNGCAEYIPVEDIYIYLGNFEIDKPKAIS